MRRTEFAAQMPYRDVYDRMQAEASRIAKGDLAEGFWIGEHALTITLGRSLKSQSQLLASPDDVTVVEVERGGGATMHNPGQLVVYPLLKLASRGLSPVSYLRSLEALIVEALAMDDIKAQALEGKTGVWVGPKKIASLGVSLIDGVTRHGLALNVLNNLGDFALINPCGFSADTMVSVKHFVPNVTLEAYKERFARLMTQRFG